MIGSQVSSGFNQTRYNVKYINMKSIIFSIMVSTALIFSLSANASSSDQRELVRRLIECKGSTEDMIKFQKLDNYGKGKINRLSDEEAQKYSSIVGLLAKDDQNISAFGFSSKIFWAGGMGKGLDSFGLVFLSKDIVHEVRAIANKLQLTKVADNEIEQIYINFIDNDKTMVLWNAAYGGEKLGDPRSMQYTLNCFYGEAAAKRNREMVDRHK